MTDEDRPPERIWLDDEAVAEHFERVMARHASGNPSREEIPDAQMTSNELTADFKR